MILCCHSGPVTCRRSSLDGLIADADIVHGVSLTPPRLSFEHDRAKRKARWSKRQGFADARHHDFGRIALEPVENGGEGRLRRRYHVERDNHSQSLSAKVLPNIGAKFTMKEAAPSGDVPRGRWHSPDLIFWDYQHPEEDENDPRNDFEFVARVYEFLRAAAARNQEMS